MELNITDYDLAIIIELLSMRRDEALKAVKEIKDAGVFNGQGCIAYEAQRVSEIIAKLKGEG